MLSNMQLLLSSKLRSCVSVLVHIKYPHIVVTVAQPAFISAQQLTYLHNCFHLFLWQSAEVRQQEVLQYRLCFFIGDNCLLASANCIELILEKLSILRNDCSNPLVFPCVLPERHLIRLQAQLAISFVDMSECLLPLTLIDYSILPDVDGIKQVLNNWIGRYFFSSNLMSFDHKVAELLVSEFSQSALVEL